MKRLDLDFIASHSNKIELFSSLLENNEIHVCISYLSDFKNAKILRESVDEICKVYDISPKWRTRLVLIIDELNNNAIEYGSNAWDTNFLEIHIQKTKTWNISLEVFVSDTWKGQNSKKAQDMEQIRKLYESKNYLEHHSIRGRGLFLIISHLVDDLRFKDNPEGWLTVEIQKKLA